jgi:hypothetical protein
MWNGEWAREWESDAGTLWSAGGAALLAREVAPDWGDDPPPEADADASGDARASRARSPAALHRLVPAHYLGVDDVLALSEDDYLDEVAHQIVRRVAHLSAAEYQVLVLIREFDRLRGWERSGHRDCAQWLEYHTGMSRITARERVRVAWALEELPETSQAMSRGELNYSKARVLARAATRQTEGDLLSLAMETTAHRFQREVQRLNEEETLGAEERERRRHQRRRLTVVPTDGGMYRVNGLVAPEVGALLKRVLEGAGDALFDGDREWSPEAGKWGLQVDEIKPEQRWADALHLVLEQAMKQGFDAGCLESEEAEDASDARASDDAAASTPKQDGCSCLPSNPSADRYLVSLLVDLKTLQETKAGAGIRGAGREATLDAETTISPATARRLTCDSAVVRIVHRARSEILDVGRKTRVVPVAIRRALWARDRGCRFPGCGCRFVEPHHIRHWALGGKTSLCNLVLLCLRHHKMVHGAGLSVRMGAGQVPEFFNRKGVRIPDRPPPAPRLSPEARRDPGRALPSARELDGPGVDPWRLAAGGDL